MIFHNYNRYEIIYLPFKFNYIAKSFYILVDDSLQIKLKIKDLIIENQCQRLFPVTIKVNNKHFEN